jgi:hypothetical protein
MDEAVGGQTPEHGEEGLLAHAEGGAQGGARHGRGRRLAHEGEGALAEGIGRDGVLAEEARARGGCHLVDVQPQAQGRRTGGGAVLDAELERGVGAEAPEVEVGVAEGVQIAGAPQTVAGDAPGGRLAGVMHEQDGAGGGAGEGAQAVEDDGHLGGGVFVGPVQANEGIEDEQAGPDARDGGGEAVQAVGQADAGLDDDLDRERGERLLAARGKRGEALDDDGRRILGRAQQDGARGRDGKAAGGRGRRGDGDGEFEGEEALAGLGGAAQDSRRADEEEGRRAASAAARWDRRVGRRAASDTGRRAQACSSSKTASAHPARRHACGRPGRRRGARRWPGG